MAGNVRFHHIFIIDMLLSYFGTNYFDSICERARDVDDLLFSQRLPSYHIRELEMIEYHNVFSITTPKSSPIQPNLPLPTVISSTNTKCKMTL